MESVVNERVALDSSNICWSETLDQAKKIQQKNLSDATFFLNFVKSRCILWNAQLTKYASEMSNSKSDSILTSSEIKNLVLRTRTALRFGLCCLSREELAPTDDVIPTIQAMVVLEYNWDETLTELLSQERGDSKCRVFAARLLCNLVTSNPETAKKISSRLPLSPSPEFVSSSILESLSKDELADSKETSAVKREKNWVDMILSAAKSGNREAVAAVAAALHNCIASLCQQDDVGQKDVHQFVIEVASNGLLISTLLRHFVSAQTIASYQKQDTIDAQSKESGFLNHWDAASEWIQILLSKLALLGMLPRMFYAIASTSSHDDDSEKEIPLKLVPEQLVLLNCMSREADSFVRGSSAEAENPFGGNSDLESVDQNFLFLSELLITLSPCLQYKPHDNFLSDRSFDISIARSGMITVTDILASCLGVDTSLSKCLRSYLCRECTILQSVAISLGVVTDALAEQANGHRTRDIRLTTDDKKLLTSLVRLIGNLCYGCRQNQELLRTTLVPRSSNYTKIQGREESFASSVGVAETRNGLHVLLTCTTYATSCFTLREWGVIAIRNALEGNAENQAVVAELVAQDPAQSADLEHAGIKVKLDSKGKVTLSRIHEDEVNSLDEEGEQGDNQEER
jgi:hypothetical protein